MYKFIIIKYGILKMFCSEMCLIRCFSSSVDCCMNIPCERKKSKRMDLSKRLIYNFYVMKKFSSKILWHFLLHFTQTVDLKRKF